MMFEARIGERFESNGLEIVWVPRGGDAKHAPDTAWIKAIRGGPQERDALQQARLRKRRRAKRGDLNGRLYNVSVSGAGLVAESDDRCSMGTGVTVELEPGNFFDARIRRVEEVAESGSTYFGVEYIHTSEGYDAWLREIYIAHRGRHPLTPAPLLKSSGLGAEAADQRTGEGEGEDETQSSRTPEDEAELARKNQRCRELATAFLPDPVFEIAGDGSSRELLNRRLDLQRLDDPESETRKSSYVADPAELPYHDEPPNPFEVNGNRKGWRARGR